MRLAVIPARGGSKRIPRKNVRDFAGKPMITRAIEAARACTAIERVIVSTDDDEIARVAAEAGAGLPFRRPAALADDRVGTQPVIRHAIETCLALGWDVRQVCCIYPAVPLLLPEDLELGATLLDAHGGEGFVFPIVRFPSPIQRALRRGPRGAVTPFDPGNVGTRTQDLEPAYYDAGQFYWGSAQSWVAGLPVHANAHTLVLPEWRAVDIDTPEDWERAERLFAAARS